VSVRGEGDKMFSSMIRRATSGHHRVGETWSMSGAAARCAYPTVEVEIVHEPQMGGEIIPSTDVSVIIVRVTVAAVTRQI
jgi:hypothetical protein